MNVFLLGLTVTHGVADGSITLSSKRTCPVGGSHSATSTGRIIKNEVRPLRRLDWRLHSADDTSETPMGFWARSRKAEEGCPAAESHLAKGEFVLFGVTDVVEMKTRYIVTRACLVLCSRNLRTINTELLPFAGKRYNFLDQTPDRVECFSYLPPHMAPSLSLGTLTASSKGLGITRANLV